VGTSPDFADILIDDRSVSRMHARISEDRSGNPLLTDLNSTNGTWINGIRLQPEESVPVGKGDVIRFGEAEFCCR
jgi:pSer/pThr/pTyr-binding forkhead associated (FHA) protein